MRLNSSELGAATLLPVTLIALFARPEGSSGISLALVWLVFMLLAALPSAFLESALARRARHMPFQGLAQLTRDADARTTWRAQAPLSMVILAALAALAAAAVPDFLPAEPEWLGVSSPWLLLALAALMAWAGLEKLLALGGLLTLGGLITVFFLGQPALTLTTPDADTWRHGALLALLSCGAGTGIQAWLALRGAQESRAAATVLPFWAVQAVTGALAFLAGDLHRQPAACIYAVPAVFAVGLMLHVLTQQLTARGYSRLAALGVATAGTGGLTVLALQPTFGLVIQLLGLLPLLVLAVFAGWIMKISHVRKALNFESEAVYNLWRVAVRLLVPGLCLWVIAGVFL